MALTCPDCETQIEISDKQRRLNVGKFVTCPKCGARRRLPPLSDTVATKIINIEREFKPNINDRDGSSSFSRPILSWLMHYFSRALLIYGICATIGVLSFLFMSGDDGGTVLVGFVFASPFVIFSIATLLSLFTWVRHRWPLIKWLQNLVGAWLGLRIVSACIVAFGLFSNDVSHSTETASQAQMIHVTLIPTCLFLLVVTSLYAKADLFRLSVFPQPRWPLATSIRFVILLFFPWIGLIIGLFWPLWGGVLLLGKFGSHARNSLLSSHVFVFGVIGIVIVLGLTFLRRPHAAPSR